MCDLDGVVYRGSQPVQDAVESLNTACERRTRVVYATNNASRAPAAVAAQLREMGIELTDDDVVNSSQAGARRVLRMLGAGARVLAVGGPGLSAALHEYGLEPVTAVELAADPSGGVAAVLQGLGHDIGWPDLAQAAYAIQAGATWVATNLDRTLPTEHGLAPGNGAMIAAVRCAVGSDPVAVGKPAADLYELAAHAAGASLDQMLAIGDRLDTDITGAQAAGMDSLMVLTGVDGPVDLSRVTDPVLRPTYVASTLAALFDTYDYPVAHGPGRWRCGQATVTLSGSGDELRLHTATSDTSDRLLRAALSALWSQIDTGGSADHAAAAMTTWLAATTPTSESVPEAPDASSTSKEDT